VAAPGAVQNLSEGGRALSRARAQRTETGR